MPLHLHGQRESLGQVESELGALGRRLGLGLSASATAGKRQSGTRLFKLGIPRKEHQDADLGLGEQPWEVSPSSSLRRGLAWFLLGILEHASRKKKLYAWSTK